MACRAQEQAINKEYVKYIRYKRGDIEFVHNGYGVAIASTYHDKKITFLLTAYKKIEEKNREQSLLSIYKALDGRHSSTLRGIHHTNI